jgi:imidazolonepropionase-like amidohydrolase
MSCLHDVYHLWETNLKVIPCKINLFYFLFLYVCLISACSESRSPSPDPSAGPEERSLQPEAEPRSLPEPKPVYGADLVIQGGQLLDMVRDEPNLVSIKGLVIRDGRIERVIPSNVSEALPEAATTIDATSLYIMPGLIDSHVHFHPWTLPATVWRRGNLHYGVTTIMDTGPSGAADHCTGDLAECQKADPNEWILAFKDFLNNSPESNGPTLYVTGMKLDVIDSAYQFSSHRFQNLEEIPEYVEYLVGLGVDAIKVEKGLPLDYRKKIIEEANRHGLQVVGHSKDARESISVGMKFIEHMWPVAHSLADDPKPESFNSPDHDHLMNLDRAPALIRLMVEERVYLNPTMTGRYGELSERAASFTKEDEALLQFGEIHSIGIEFPSRLLERILAAYALPEDISTTELQNLRQGFGKIQTFLKEFSEAGGFIIAATDNTMVRLPGVSMHREMRMLVDAGIAPYRVLLGATRWPAEMLYKDDLIGTIEAGKQADILLLGSNPADDIDNSRDIRYVIRKGTIQRSPEECSVIESPVSQTCW